MQLDKHSANLAVKVLEIEFADFANGTFGAFDP
jgi:hypothetical protein